MTNDDKTFYHKALVWSAFFVLGDKTTCYCLSSLRNISSPYFSLNRNYERQLLCCTNRCNWAFPFIKKSRRPQRTILFEKCTAKTLVMLYISKQNTNKSETILHTKPFIAFLNRKSGIKRGQPHNAYNIIITDPKQRQPLCFFVSLSNLFGWVSLSFL